jgi:hypothetical protein
MLYQKQPSCHRAAVPVRPPGKRMMKDPRSFQETAAANVRLEGRGALRRILKPAVQRYVEGLPQTGTSARSPIAC